MCVENPQAPPPKQRRIKLLDACVERFPEHDARVLASLIIQGKVLVDDAPQYKAGTPVVPSVHLRIRGAPCKYVSRCGMHGRDVVQDLTLGTDGIRCMWL